MGEGGSSRMGWEKGRKRGREEGKEAKRERKGGRKEGKEGMEKARKGKGGREEGKERTSMGWSAFKSTKGARKGGAQTAAKCPCPLASPD
eukprot:364471-Chlamydomonas_euryale.AAC.1